MLIILKMKLCVKFFESNYSFFLNIIYFLNEEYMKNAIILLLNSNQSSKMMFRCFKLTFTIPIQSSKEDYLERICKA